MNFYTDSDPLSMIRTKASFNAIPLSLQATVRKRKGGLPKTNVKIYSFSPLQAE